MKKAVDYIVETKAFECFTELKFPPRMRKKYTNRKYG